MLPVLLLVVDAPHARAAARRAGAPVRWCAWRGAGAVALLAVALVPPLGLGDPQTEQTAVALVLVGHRDRRRAPAGAACSCSG